VDETLLFNDYPVTLVDTMGFSCTPGNEHDAELAHRFSTEADYLVTVQDAGNPRPGIKGMLESGKVVLDVINKCDKIKSEDRFPACTGRTVAVSVLMDTGIDVLLEKLFDAIPGCRHDEIEPGLFSDAQKSAADEACREAAAGNPGKGNEILKRTFLK
jgi:predicted GTPase